MALNIAKPFVNVTDSNGMPYVGALLYVYLPGTTTLASIYSDEALTVPMTNPLSGVNASDAAGNFPRAYIAAGTYKLRAEQKPPSGSSTGTLIWEYDNIDSGLPASTGALPITRGGTGATTAAGARTNLDVPSNSELASLSDTISSIQTAIQNIVASPQGRLTLTSGVPVLASGVAAATTVYYTPYVGNITPLYDGAQFNPIAAAELSLTLNSNYVINSHYDVFMTLDDVTPILVTGPAWTTITAGSGARGTGAGTTEITRVNGLYVNANALTGRNGATTYSVAANRATYLGSILIDGTAGQVSCLTAFGQSRIWGVWNAYNRKAIVMQAGDATASWTYSFSSFRASNNAAANKLTTFCGLAEEAISVEFYQTAGGASNNSTSTAAIGIGLNSVTVASGRVGEGIMATGAVGVGISPLFDITARYFHQPQLGSNVINCLEAAPNSNTVTFLGSSTNMLMTAKYTG